jgi:hypothetical protein
MSYKRPLSWDLHSDALIKSKARKYSRNYTQEFAEDTLLPAHSQPRSFGKDFIGQQ